MNKAITISSIICITLLGILSFLLWDRFQVQKIPQPSPYIPLLIMPSVSPSPSPSVSPSPSPSPSPTPLPKRASISAPFIVQAPGGLWEEQLFQDGCEEASLLMAWHWLQGTTVTDEAAAQAIRDMSAFEDRTYGKAPDRSAGDTMRLMKEYFNYSHVRVEYAITNDDIKKELAQGNLVITPMNGRAIKNPYYNAPGPDKHMIVVTGYDDMTNQFITNDPGTMHGENYLYPQDIFLAGIRDYPTGNHKPIPERVTAMIVVEKGM